MKFLRWLFAGALFISLSGAADEPDWSLYTAILKKHTEARTVEGIALTWIDYSALQADPRFELVVEQLSAYPLERLVTRQEKLAFYINAYNILALKVVVDHWPVASIKDAGSWFTPVWYRRAGHLGGNAVTLDHIEHSILRPMQEPRVHMAIVCASLSCPDLRAEPYRATQLETQLTEQSRLFLANPAKGIGRSGDGVRISRIFDWFESDFEVAGGVGPWIRRYSGQALPAEYGFLPYLWGVNGG